MKNIKEFCNKINITENQFYGKATVGGSLGLDGLTSIPEGFNPTVGGSLGLKNGFSNKKKKPTEPIITPKNKLLFWQNGKYVSADRILTEVISKKGNIYKVRKIHSSKEFYLVTDGKIHAHGDSIKSASEDFKFKIISEKLKNEPITEETEITVLHYRTVTGACEFGCRDFMDKNNIPYEIINDKVVEKNKIKAKDLLPMLEKSNAYGFERFKSLIQ